MNKLVFRGRRFTKLEIEKIKNIIKKHKNCTRRKISELVCEMLSWKQPNNRLKDRACRDALLRMHRKGIIKLPPPCRQYFPKNYKPAEIYKNRFKIKKKILSGDISDYHNLNLLLVNRTENEKLWNFLIDKYHYIGYKTPVGRYLKYLVHLDSNLVGCISFADAVLKLNLRDKWLGWSSTERGKNLKLIINNNRFLILPWVRIKNLGSKILSLAVKQVQKDWEQVYGYRPVLIESFIDISKFAGTCYKASNWLYLGKTIGKGRCGMKYFVHNLPKSLYVYPLCKEYLSLLKCK